MHMTNAITVDHGVRPRGTFIGLTVLDVMNRVDRAPGVNEKMTAHRQDIAAGGPATNAAVAFAALGGQATLITAIGTGGAADLARADLEQRGIDVIDCAHESAILGVSCINVLESTGERSVVSPDDLMLPAQLAPHTRERVVEALSSSDVLLLDGHHADLLQEILELGVSLPTTVVDAGRWKPQFEWILSSQRHIVASNDFVDPHGWMPSESRGPSGPLSGGIVVRTRGAGTIQWFDRERCGTVNTQRVEAKDTLGAGDAFHGGYAFGVATNGAGALVENLTLGAKVAATRVSHVGPRDWLRYLDSAMLPA